MSPQSSLISPHLIRDFIFPKGSHCSLDQGHHRGAFSYSLPSLNQALYRGLLSRVVSVLHNKLALKVIIPFLCIFLMISPLHAQVFGEDQQKPAKLDIMILMDSSGSMLVTDPQRLRDRGVEMFVERLSSDDRVGLVKFAEDAKVLLPLNTYSVSLPKLLQAELSKVESTGINTNIYGGIEVTAKQLLSSVRDDATPIIVLLSDGKMEPPAQFGEPKTITKKLVDDLLPDLRAKNIRIYTLSFSDQADRELLAQIAKSTDAASWYTPSVDTLQKSFEDLLQVLKKPIAATNKPKGLLVEHDVEEATFYLTRTPSQSLTLVSPTGDSYREDAKPDNIRWFKGEDFDVVSIKSPAVGTWNIEGFGTEEGFTTVMPELGMAVKLPPIIRADSPIDISISLVNGAKPVALKKLIDHITYEFEITPSDRVSEPVVKGTLSPNMGEEGALIEQGSAQQTVRLEEEGEYALLVKAKGPTFSREQNLPFVVKPALITMKGILRSDASSSKHDVDTKGHNTQVPEDEQEDVAVHEEPHLSQDKSGEDTVGGHQAESHESDDAEHRVESLVGFNIALHPDALRYKDTSVRVVVIDSRNNRREFKAERIPSDPKKYRLDLKDLPEDGDYTAVAILSGLTMKGEPVENESAPLEFKFTNDLAKETLNKDGHTDASLGVHADRSHLDKGKTEDSAHATSASNLQLAYITLAIVLANTLGLLIALRLVGIKIINSKKTIVEPNLSEDSQPFDEQNITPQSELDELKAFVERVELKVISQDVDPLDSRYDEIVMRVEERLASEDLQQLSDGSQDGAEITGENRPQGGE